MSKLSFRPVFISLVIFVSLLSQTQETIKLNQPDLNKGLNVMQALKLRKSTRKFNPRELNLQDLSDLLWAANGVNRSGEKKRTAPSAMNAQDIDIYVFTKEAVYFYNSFEHQLEKILGGDYRKEVAGRQQKMANAPVFLVLVSDLSRFPRGDESKNILLGAMDAGIVSQNISIFCASRNLATVPRASMNRESLRKILKLKNSQRLMLNHPVSYMKQR